MNTQTQIEMLNARVAVAKGRIGNHTVGNLLSTLEAQAERDGEVPNPQPIRPIPQNPSRSRLGNLIDYLEG